MRQNRLSLYVVIALVIVAGGLAGAIIFRDACGFGSARQTWELDTWIPEQQTLDNGSTRMTIEVILSGHVTNTRIEGLQLTLLEENGSTMQTVDIGTLSGYTRANRTIVVDRLPQRIEVQTEEIHSPPSAEYYFSFSIEELSTVNTEDAQVEG